MYLDLYLMNISDTYSLLHVCIGNKVLLLYICVLKYRTSIPMFIWYYMYYEYIYIEIVHIHEKIPKHLWKKIVKKFVNVRMCHALTLNASFDIEHGFRCIENGPHAKD